MFLGPWHHNDDLLEANVYLFVAASPIAMVRIVPTSVTGEVDLYLREWHSRSIIAVRRYSGLGPIKDLVPSFVRDVIVENLRWVKFSPDKHISWDTKSPSDTEEGASDE